MIWTPNNVDRLIELSNTKLTSTKIAMELGTTKNAVIGKLHRMRVKNGHTPKPLQTRNNRRLSTSYFKKLGKKPCSLCKDMFMSYSKYDKFCDRCKRRSPYVDCQMSRIYEVEIMITKTEIYHVKAKDDADLVKECQFSKLQKKSNNVKYVRTDDELRKMGGWSDISNVK